MFNPSQENSSPEAIWDLMGTFFALLPQEDKKVFETYYESLSRVNSGLFYSLYQSESLRYFSEQEGWYELLYKEYPLTKKDNEGRGRENLVEEFLAIPKNLSATFSSGAESYVYKVTAVNSNGETTPSQVLKVSDALLDGGNPINISWDSVEGATSYNVYGRLSGDYKLLGNTASTSFSDSNVTPGTQTPPSRNDAFKGYGFNLETGFVYLSIPTLESDGVTLTEGVDYSIKENSKLFFPDGVLDSLFRPEFGTERRIFKASTSLVLSPVLTSIFLKALGATPSFYKSLPYQPFIEGYELLDNLDQKLALGKHYKFLTWALCYYSRKSPSMANLRKLYALVKGYPFAYEAGTVTDVNEDIITIGDFTYDVGIGATNLTVGDEVEKFQILSTGTRVKDWVSDPVDVEAATETNEEKRLVMLLESDFAYPYSEDLLKSFKKNSIPAGVILKEL
jgi:hypothetical protein